MINNKNMTNIKLAQMGDAYSASHVKLLLTLRAFILVPP